MGFQIRRAAATAISLAGILVIPSIGTAQATLRGVLYDDVSGLPVRGTVMLVDPATDAAVVHATTDSLGQFSLQIGNGVYQIGAVRPGYTSVLSAPVPLANGERLTIRLPIAAGGDPQHHIGVVEHVRPDPTAVRLAEQMARGPGAASFEARRATGTGLHYDRARLEKANVNTLGEFLQNVPGMSVLDPASTSSMQMSRSAVAPVTGGGVRGTLASCHVGWFVDGVRVDIPGRSDPMTDGLGGLPIETVEALEVFRGLSEMPTEFASPDLRCGAIAVWTRHG